MTDFQFDSLDADLEEACFDVFGERTELGEEQKAQIVWRESQEPLSVGYSIIEQLAAGQGSGDRYYESLGERITILVKTAELGVHKPLPIGTLVRLPEKTGTIDPSQQFTLSTEDSKYGPVVCVLRLDRERMARQHSMMRKD